MTTLRAAFAASLFAGMAGLASVPAHAESPHDFFVQEAARREAAKAAPVAAVVKGNGAIKIDGAIRNTGMNNGNAALHELVRREARAHGVPITLAKAIVTVESRWNPRVTGRAGEVGLMQIKYQTARGMGYTGSRQGLYDPATNIRYGMKYLAGAHRLAKGDVCGTVSRYQGGHGVRGVTRAGSVYCRKAKSIMAQLPAAAPRISAVERTEGNNT